MGRQTGLELVDHRYYGANGPPHEFWTELRRESPVHRCVARRYPPFWAITKHEDICAISKDPERFLSSHGIVLLRDDEPSGRDEGIGALRTIIEMDPPEHRSYRKVASPWFTPRAMQKIEETVAASARDLVDQLAGEGECDFAIDVATAHPLRILSKVLGVPRESEPKILELTNQLFAKDDPELQRPGEDREKAVQEMGLEIFNLFSGIIEDRRANPQDDLASLLANAKVNGELMGPMETFGYYLITFTAGHDTTKNALVNGMKALVEHPDELEKLKRDPSLINSAVEEIVRWTSPVNYMMRTAAVDVELRGQKIAKDDRVLLFYASANRDEEVFDAPFEFRVDRDPNPHLGFGIGEHFCLGSHLARRSQRALFSELIRRLEWVEPAGEPRWIHSSFIVGLKNYPLRYRIRKDG